MTITELIAKVWPRMGLPSSNSFFTTANITSLLNDGYRDFVFRTKCLRKFVLIDITAETQSYDLPSDNLHPVWFGYDKGSVNIRQVSTRDLDRLSDQWTDDASGTPGKVTIGLDGSFGKFYLWPMPNVSSTVLGDSTTALTDFEDWDANVLIFYEYEIEMDLTAGQTPDIEKPFQWAMVYYALWKAFENESSIQDLDQSAFWRTRYESKIEEKKSLLTESVSIVLGSLTVIDAYDEPDTMVHDMIEWELFEIDEIILDEDGSLIFGRYDSVSESFLDGAYKETRLESDGTVGDDLITYRFESGSWVEKSRCLLANPISDIVADTTSNLIKNGDMENWASPTNLDYWTEIVEGSSTLNRIAAPYAYIGSYAVELYIAPGEIEWPPDGVIGLYQDYAFVVGVLYTVSVIAKVNKAVAGRGFYLCTNNDLESGSLISANTLTNVTASYSEYIFTFTATSDDDTIALRRYIYGDDDYYLYIGQIRVY